MKCLVGLICLLPVIALASDFKVSGYIDGSYNYLVRSNRFSSGSYDRVFDLDANGVSLQQAAITISDQPKEGLGGLLNIIAGRDANIIASYGWNPYFGSPTLAFDPTQVYVQYAHGPFTVLLGKFVGTAGAEVIDPTQNTTFSRSILDGFAEPFTFTGIRGTYTVNDKISLLTGVNNGWDSFRDTSRRKNVELGVTLTPSSKFTLATVFYTGGERAGGNKVDIGPESTRDFLDIVATLNATDKLTFILNYDYGNQTLADLPTGNVGEAVWQGLAGYANYQVTDKWQTSIRGEIYSDRNGFMTGVAQCWKEVTLALAYLPMKNVELRAETRHDFSNVNAFVNRHGMGVNSNQQSYALEGFYKFPG